MQARLSPPHLWSTWVRAQRATTRTGSLQGSLLRLGTHLGLFAVSQACLEHHRSLLLRPLRGLEADMATKRLLREYGSQRTSPNPHLLSLQPVDEDDLTHWKASFAGQPDSPYSDGVFDLDIQTPQDYPLRPPTIRFLTRICHPNINFNTGEICLDILKSQWSPAWTIQSACTAVRELLVSPEPDSPLNIDAANLLRCKDIQGYESLIRLYVDMYALPVVGHAKVSCNGPTHA